jgi:hypothetical protein
LETLVHEAGPRKTWNHSIPVAKAIELPDATLPIKPYSLGAWLGDGSSYTGNIYGIDHEVFDFIEADGYSSTLESRSIKSSGSDNELFRAVVFPELRKLLRQEGLLLKRGESVKRNGSPKRIPAVYLRSSISQRKELLAGLMDTDGNATKSASVEFTSVYKDFAYDVYELVLSLGYRATINESDAKINGKFISKKYVIRWSTNDDVFKLSRKIKSHREYSKKYNESKNNQRYIVAVNPVDTVPTRCITVDSPNSLYLVGKNFIPTHNTAASAMLLGTFMSHENHAILVIDPQGQWSNENGIPFSPQKFAKGLGREVSVLRMGEDIRLPMEVEIFSRMMTKINLWSRFRKMGPESRDAFSREVAERISRLSYKDYNVDPRDLLSKVFKDIANSQSSMARIYATVEKQESLRSELLMLSGEPVFNSDGEQMIFNEEDLADIEANWGSILFAFKPLHNLFSTSNLEGGKRRPLGGDTGFLTGIFQVRGDNPTKPAPYVVIDMSPNVKLHAKAGLAKNDDQLAMQKVLDNGDIKALMLQMILHEMKKSSEVAFASSNGGNLNTQIVFDEAWRFAPEGKSTPEIEELANMLEGFALDTRKFGIGWTYILQSPADLKHGIWKQLSYVLTGYGLVGEDVRRLEALTDDVSQIDLYRQFIAPAATKQYPFMFMGPISPLIFSTSPTFINAFTNVGEFLEANEKWIKPILKRRGMPSITVEYMNSKLIVEKDTTKPPVEKEFTVGKDKKDSEPQFVKKQEKPTSSDKTDEDDGLAPLPF